jgi:hypothetical protein
MRGVLIVLFMIFALGCEGANDVAAPPPPHPTPTPAYYVSGTVVANGFARLATVIATSAGTEVARTRSRASTGSFQIGPLPVGEIQLKAVSDGCGSPTLTVTVPADRPVVLDMIQC